MRFGDFEECSGAKHKESNQSRIFKFLEAWLKNISLSLRDF